ncbi:MAG TPA: phosphoribosylamine--glycine ligase [Actinomycetota bacterium]|nr:phosphoribosylamine--glycine ligase [Actinomycetota bacterium]
MKVVLLGSGGRESALAWALDRSRAVEQLVVAPGNAGTERIAENIDIDASDRHAVLNLAKRVGPDLVVVGPEAPLVAGVGDALRAERYPVFGPDSEAARIEGSKTHAKDLMERAGIPTASARAFADRDEAVAYLEEIGAPYVIKADGLAAGKGVVVTSDWDEAVAAVDERLVHGAFGDAGRIVLIEEFLDGEEASVIAFTDGKSIVPCEPAQDYKRIGDGDSGPNTGGMGSYSPVPACPPALIDTICDGVIRPMVEETAEHGAPFVGALYAGLALTAKGPRVIEFNARFGDPETQALMPRLASDFAEVAMATASTELAGVSLEWRPERCVSVVLASAGYPGGYETGRSIEGIDEAEAMDDVAVFHAGTAWHDGRLVTAGGRVLAVSALGSTYAAARARAYDAAAKIHFEGKYVRGDIASRAEHTEGA